LLDDVIEKLGGQRTRNVTKNKKCDSLACCVSLASKQIGNIVGGLWRKGGPSLVDSTNCDNSMPTDISGGVRKRLRDCRDERSNELLDLKLRGKAQGSSPKVFVWMYKIIPKSVTNEEKFLFELPLPVIRLDNLVV